jgi:DNA-directed RNA polymerase specialized sigma54-like protein
LRWKILKNRYRTKNLDILSQENLAVARRTVAKYREQMNFAGAVAAEV